MAWCTACPASSAADRQPPMLYIFRQGLGVDRVTVLPLDPYVHRRIGEGPGGEGEMRIWRKTSQTFKVNCACGPCNSRWMNRRSICRLKGYSLTSRCEASPACSTTRQNNKN